MFNEMKRAHAILKASGNISEIFAQIKEEEVVSDGSSVVFLEVAATTLSQTQNKPCLPETKSWAARQVLQTLVALENELGDADLIRPMSRPVRINGKLLYVIRVKATPEDLQKILDKRVCSLQEEARAFFWQPVAGEERSLVRLVSLTASKFRKVFVQH